MARRIVGLYIGTWIRKHFEARHGMRISGQPQASGQRREPAGARCCRLLTACALLILLAPGPVPAGADTTLETDTEALAQVFFALGGPGWQNRRGWQVLEDARAQFDDVFDEDGDEVLTLEELKQGMNVNYVGCRFPPCYPTLKVHNPLFRIPEPENRFRLEEFGTCWLLCA